MNTRKRLLLWVCALCSLPAGIYTCTGFIYYAWITALEPETWPAARIPFLKYSGLTVLFFTAFVYCLMSLAAAASTAYHYEKK